MKQEDIDTIAYHQKIIDTIKKKEQVLVDAQVESKRLERETTRLQLIESKKKSVITYSQMMSKEFTFDQYMEQFVTQGLIEYVLYNIGEDVIKASTCEHLNDIDMKLWRDIGKYVPGYIDKDLYALATNNEEYALKSHGSVKFYWSDSTGVSLAKQAARHILDKQVEA